MPRSGRGSIYIIGGLYQARLLIKLRWGIFETTSKYYDMISNSTMKHKFAAMARWLAQRCGNGNVRLGACLTIVMLMLAAADMAKVSDDGMKKVTIRVKIQQGNQRDKFKYETVRYMVFRSRKKAQEAKDMYLKAIEEGEKTGFLTEAIDRVTAKLGNTWAMSDPTGTIVFNAMPGCGVLVLGDFSSKVDAIDIQSKYNTYDVVLKSGAITLDEANVYGKKMLDINIGRGGGTDFGDTVSFPIEVTIPSGYTTEESRLIIQPVVIECQSADTIDYLPPYVFEGARYNRLQDRRMDFDYEKNDSLAHALMADTLRSNHAFHFATEVMYHKRHPKKSYMCNYVVSLEDYRHIIYNSGDLQTGSCRTIKPFKFFDFSVAAVDMPLTSEFHEDAESNFDSYSQDIKLKFVQGKDELTTDSINEKTLSDFSKELRTYGDKLWNLSVEGCSSPEGSVERNTILARQRAAKASALLRGVPGDVHRSILPPRIFTWDDVLQEVRQHARPEVADMVQNVIGSHSQGEIYGALKQLPFFESDIAPVLQKQRVIRFKYMVQRERVMGADEAVEFYFANKPSLLKGTKHLSDGDYYNLFSVVRDSAELDTITMLAYKQITSKPAYERLRLAPYVANRMALMKIRQGTADPSILRPFIDLSLKKVNHTKYVDEFNTMVVNREQLLANQAVCYFQNERRDTAQFILDTYLKENEMTSKLGMFITFKNHYYNYITGRVKDEATLQKIKRAVSLVLSSSQENKAIIWTELKNRLGKKREDIEPLLLDMPDDSPKKWYLLGELWSEEAGMEPPVDAVGIGALSEQEQDELMLNDPAKYNLYMREQEKVRRDGMEDKTPYFLAFFQHSFDLKPEYKMLYFSEGNVKETTREQYPYKRKDIEAYRQKFLMIKAKLDRDREARKSVQAAGGNAGSNTSSGEDDIQAGNSEAQGSTEAQGGANVQSGTNAQRSVQSEENTPEEAAATEDAAAGK